MSKLNPRQALFLWRMITGETPEVREPLKSKAQPDIKKDRDRLITAGYLEVQQRTGRRGSFLVLTNKAWVWAGETADVELMKSAVAAAAMQGLLRRLIPFLEKSDLPLADLFRENVSPAGGAGAGPSDKPLDAQIEEACLALGNGRRRERLRLSALRAHLHQIPRPALDRELVLMQRDERLVLYRDDHTSALTAADHEAALTVGDSPRHIVYLEG